MESQVDEPRLMMSDNVKSLDIFLFSNGQQDSPPRKYNLRVNNRWEATMNFLAHSQYGSKHAIELYTIDGKRIKGPLELVHGAAYVAVEPPAAFAPAGYHDYLMKASRSREKRQERIPENDLYSTKSVKTNFIAKDPDVNKDANYINIIQDLTILSATATAVENEDAIREKVKTDIAKAVKPIRRMSTVKPTLKKNSYIPQPKKASNVAPPIKKGNNTSKVDTIKKKFEISSLKNTKNTNSSTTESKSKGDESIGIRATSFNRVHTETLQNETDITSLRNRSFVEHNTKQDLPIGSSTTASSAVLERNILLPVSVTYVEKNHRESEYINPNRGNEGVPVQCTDEERARDISNGSRMIDPQPAPSKGICKSESKPNVLNNVIEEVSQKKTIMISSQTADNNFTIHVKQGDIVNLKLNIEVKNGSSTVIETKLTRIESKQTVVKTSTPGVNAPKSDHGIRTNNVAVAKVGRDAPTLTEPWLAVPYEQIRQITDDLKVAVCGYNCCSERAAPVYVDNNNYIILLPPDDHTENSVSCTCKLEINQKGICEMPVYQQLISSSKTNILKLHEDNNVLIDKTTITKDPEKSKSAIQHAMPNEIQLLKKNVSIAEIELEQTCNCCVSCKGQSQLTACSCAQILAIKCPDCKKDEMVNNTHTFKEAFTQTVWGGIVLEARPCGNGTFVLHVPSIEVLKLCNALY